MGEPDYRRPLPLWLRIELAKDRRWGGDDLAQEDSTADPEEWGHMGVVEDDPDQH